MTALSTRPAPTIALFGAPTFSERFLLRMAEAFEVTVHRRMQRRQRDAERLAAGALDAAEARRSYMADAYRGRFLR
ncbi:hypothetical protein [Microbacterium sp.]|uniref:hypothetical protein n=1 Tax=Microbacterium sp. TaxID=51671 RepID=UPI003A8D6F67